MKRELARKVADAVLYEGYMLYPYRPSAAKNRQRWTFGILYPPGYKEVRLGTERSQMHSECLLKTAGIARVTIELRFLHLLARKVAQAVDNHFEPVNSLQVAENLVESCDEARERSIEFQVLANPGAHDKFAFKFAGMNEAELLRDKAGMVVGEIGRLQQQVQGTISFSSQSVAEGILKLTIDCSNVTALPASASDRDAVLLHSLLSAHTILTADGGEFLSLLDPPDDLREHVAGCSNVGNFPVLVGEEGEHDMLLCSPIVLYDYPQVAPESAGDFYDATEMDEMLTLRVMTLTDDEKSKMRGADARIRNLLERTEQSAREQLMKTHGVIRTLHPVSDQ